MFAACIWCCLGVFIRFSKTTTCIWIGRIKASLRLLKAEMAKHSKSADVKSAQGIPYDYFVVVDAGSHGSRVYVYRWLNPSHALEQGVDLRGQPKVSLVRKFIGSDHQQTERSYVLDSDSEGLENDLNFELSDLESVQRRESESDSDSDSEAEDSPQMGSYILPSIYTGKKWHHKIKPGVSSFNESPQKVGKHHLRHLLHLAGKVVPKSEHHRTPFFFHATAGMRLLPPNESEPIIENICRYVAEESDFFMPDCQSHVNVIDGDVEGLYGWLAINQMVGSFDQPEKHQHGKNHTTYGLLDMGGASTQVVFQPNQTEIDEHMNNMYRVTLHALPELKTKNNNTREGISEGVQPKGDIQPGVRSKGGIQPGVRSSDNVSGGDAKEGKPKEEKPKEEIAESASLYTTPKQLDSHVYSGSYLGFGMFQARTRYLKTLLQEFRHTNDLPDDTFRFRTPIPDPCVPKGYTLSGQIDDQTVDFTGSSNFNECLESIFPVLANNTYNSDAKKYSGDCNKLSKENEVSSCLLNDLIPSIDFSINHFIGVSGYWDTINSLFESQMLLPLERSGADKLQEIYDYDLIYSKTQKLCSSSLNELLEMNLSKSQKKKNEKGKVQIEKKDENGKGQIEKKDAVMKQEDLADLCFRSSWILNFLHVGLGFPRFGIDDADSQDKFKSLEFVEKLGGSSFSWTLGRAMLYANDEYTQAYNNYTAQRGGEPLSRPGYVYTASESFVFGAEERGIRPRPAFGTNFGESMHYEYEQEDTPVSSSWAIKPHRVYGSVVFLVLLVVAFFLMFGKQRRTKVLGLFRGKWTSLSRRFGYSRLESHNLDEPIEMSSMQAHKDNELFEIGEA